MYNKEFTFPVKVSGPSHAIKDGKYYGDSKYTWNFFIHFPVLTIEFAELQTGRSLIEGAGSLGIAEAELLKIARLARAYIMERVPVISQAHVEYRVAKDKDLLEQILQFQLEILLTWGGYDSMYRVKDGASIGEGAKAFIQGVDVFATHYSWEIKDYRSDY